MHMAGQERRLQNDDTSAVRPDRLDRLYTTWKIAGTFALAILYLGLFLYGSWKGSQCIRGGKARKRLYLYGTLVTFGCICPVTALILLKYQTAFYSYVWIWAAVPQTALIAWAATDFLCNLLKEKSLRNGMAALILLGILFLGGNRCRNGPWHRQRRYRH